PAPPPGLRPDRAEPRPGRRAALLGVQVAAVLPAGRRPAHAGGRVSVRPRSGRPDGGRPPCTGAGGAPAVTQLDWDRHVFVLLAPDTFLRQKQFEVLARLRALSLEP